MLGRLLSPPRASTVGIKRTRGMDTAEIIVRATSKTGAILTARIQAIGTIPLREQQIEYVEQLDTDRAFNKWRVEISDQETMANVGR